MEAGELGGAFKELLSGLRSYRDL